MVVDMSGQYARQWFPAGDKDVDSKVKPVRFGTCQCGRESYRERYQPGVGWQWLCYTCAPDPRIERRYASGHRPQSYVPSNYDANGPSSPDRIAAKLKSGDYVAVQPNGKISDGWRPKRATQSID